MSRTAPFRTAALIGRDWGLALLRDGLLDNDLIDLLGVFTHGRLPKAEGGGARPELQEYKSICEARNITLTVIDGPDAKQLEKFLPEKLDLLIVLSWRFILNSEALRRPKVASINLHRGALPEFSGAEPVRRAIEAGALRTAITAHKMVEEVDMGPEIARIWLDVPPLSPNVSSVAYAEIVKKRLLDLYAPLARLAIKAIAA